MLNNLEAIKGAIVKFYYCFSGINLPDVVKIISVDKYELVVIPQKLVAMNGPYMPKMGTFKVDLRKSVDIPGSEIHIDLSVIVGWEYYKIGSIVTKIYYDVYIEEQIAQNHMNVNLYDEDGFFKGPNGKK